jgi:hypothetical protein
MHNKHYVADLIKEKEVRGWERSINSVLVTKTERKTTAGRPRLSLDNIKVDLKEKRWEDVDRTKFG